MFNETCNICPVLIVLLNATDVEGWTLVSWLAEMEDDAASNYF